MTTAVEPENKADFTLAVTQDGGAELAIVGTIYHGWTSEEIKYQLQYLGDIDSLVVNLTSLGGSPLESIAIGEMLSAHVQNLEINVIGYAMSAAVNLLQFATKRTMTANSLLMIHEVKANTHHSRTAKELRGDADMVETITALSAGLMAKRGKGDVAHFLQLMETDTYLTAEQALAEGLIDEITASAEFEQSFDSALSFVQAAPGLLQQHESQNPMSLLARFMQKKTTPIAPVAPGKTFTEAEVEQLLATCQTETQAATLGDVKVLKKTAELEARKGYVEQSAVDLQIATATTAAVQAETERQRDIRAKFAAVSQSGITIQQAEPYLLDPSIKVEQIDGLLVNALQGTNLPPIQIGDSKGPEAPKNPEVPSGEQEHRTFYQSQPADFWEDITEDQYVATQQRLENGIGFGKPATDAE